MRIKALFRNRTARLKEDRVFAYQPLERLFGFEVGAIRSAQVSTPPPFMIKTLARYELAMSCGVGS